MLDDFKVVLFSKTDLLRLRRKERTGGWTGSEEIAPKLEVATRFFEKRSWISAIQHLSLRCFETRHIKVTSLVRAPALCFPASDLHDKDLRWNGPARSFRPN